MKVEAPKTLEELEKERETILDKMASPFCDQFIFLLLSEKLDKTNTKIEELRNPSANRSIQLCGFFEADNRSSSATKCKCGREKWEHPRPKEYQNLII